jgi:hypothetical protein
MIYGRGYVGVLVNAAMEKFNLKDGRCGIVSDGGEIA